MTADDAAVRAPAGGIGMLRLDEFLDIIRHDTRFMPETAANSDPLERAAENIERNPAFAQSRVLTRVLAALAEGGGEFRHADASVFDAETLKIIMGLIRTKAAGTFSPAYWDAALSRARTAVTSTNPTPGG